jgi:hypothetical protein
MGLTIPTEIHKGPFIIKQNDFENLESVVVEVEKYLKESLDNEIIATVESENSKEALSKSEKAKKITEASKRNSFDKREKKITLISADGKRLLGKSIREILKDSSLDTFNPKEFHLFIEYGNSNNVKLEIPANDNGELRLDINCFDISKSNDIRLDLNNWLGTIKPPNRVKLWSDWAGLMIILLLFPLLILSIGAFSSDYSTYESVLSKESNDLLKQGINENNVNKAVEIILKKQTKFVPSDFVGQKIEKDPNNLRWFFITLFIFTVALLRPVTTIGLGKKKWKLDFYKIWIPFVTYTVPVTLIASLWTLIKQLIHLP